MSGGTEYAEALVRAEAKIARLESALASRHGGEPIALLAELDAERERHTAAERRAEALAALVREALPDTMGGYPDLFAPAGGWDGWEERARAALSSGGPDATR